MGTLRELYGKQLTSDTLFAKKTKSLAVNSFTYTIYSKDRKHRTSRDTYLITEI